MRLSALILTLLLGCAATAPPKDGPTWCLNKELESGARAWREELRRHGKADLPMLVCHGRDFWGTWILQPDSPMPMMTAEAALHMMKRAYPGQDLVFVSCNPARLTLPVADVWYGMDEVWALPGKHYRDVPTRIPWGFVLRHDEPGVGCFDEFTILRLDCPR